jgi:4-hydroxythreonine-4-phosphate dehydrogenase
MGDPAGVGPEIICKALAELSPTERAASVIVGARRYLERANEICRSGLQFVDLAPALPPGAVPLVEVELPAGVVEPCRVSVAGGDAAYRCVARAVELCLAGTTEVIVTTPLNKEAMHAAGHGFDGHTELLAHLTGVKQTFMLLASEKLSTIHVSTHVSLAGAVKRATTERVLATIRAGHEHFRRMGVSGARIAVSGLNPHSGENGIFGTEELDFIAPAVKLAQAEGIAVSGPLPGDTVFYRAMQGEFDLVVAQYHDQGHIPTKLIAFDTTVNVSLGLPIRRTSVDHGTAFDIAWQGRAKHVNLRAAIAYARRMANADAAAAAA